MLKLPAGMEGVAEVLSGHRRAFLASQQEERRNNDPIQHVPGPPLEPFLPTQDSPNSHTFSDAHLSLQGWITPPLPYKLPSLTLLFDSDGCVATMGTPDLQTITIVTD